MLKAEPAAGFATTAPLPALARRFRPARPKSSTSCPTSTAAESRSVGSGRRDHGRHVVRPDYPDPDAHGDRSTPGSSRFGAAIGADTVAFGEFRSGDGRQAGIMTTAQGQVVAASALNDQSPQVSPDGQAIVWERCVGSTCDIQGPAGQRRLGRTSVTNTPGNQSNPDTDGTWIVYDADRARGIRRDRTSI